MRSMRSQQHARKLQLARDTSPRKPEPSCGGLVVGGSGRWSGAAEQDRELMAPSRDGRSKAV